MAAGIRTAPNVTTPTSHRRVSFSLIDSSGTIRTDSYYVPATTTLAQIEAYAEALQAVSGASMYKIEITDVFEGAQSRSNAQSQSHDSVFKNIVIGTNIPSKINESISVYIPAPDPVNFWDNTDRWNPDKMAPAAFIKAALLMLGGAERVPTGYRFTQRRKSGRRTKI